MATGGDENENPFSYKKFMREKDKEKNIHNNVNDNIETQKMPLDLVEEENNKINKNVRKNKQSDSSFSMTKFLKNSNINSNVNLQSRGFDLANDLPDFVQDHIPIPDNTNNLQNKLITSNHRLPDFALDTTLTTSQREFRNRNGANIMQMNLQPAEYEPPNAKGELPEILFDSNVLINNGSTKNEINHLIGNDEYEIRKLRQENRQLRLQLDEARNFSKAESLRVENVLHEMADIQKREKEETAAMESVVQSVEANLAAAIKRSEVAEAEVIHLKKTFKDLKQRNDGLYIENRALKNGKCIPYNEAAKQKTKEAAQQLKKAANTAQSTLKQLLTGVEQINLIADVLSSIEKITDASYQTGENAYSDSID